MLGIKNLKDSLSCVISVLLGNYSFPRSWFFRDLVEFHSDTKICSEFKTQADPAQIFVDFTLCCSLSFMFCPTNSVHLNIFKLFNSVIFLGLCGFCLSVLYGRNCLRAKSCGFCFHVSHDHSFRLLIVKYLNHFLPIFLVCRR